MVLSSYRWFDRERRQVHLVELVVTWESAKAAIRQVYGWQPTFLESVGYRVKKAGGEDAGSDG
jgi:hypothetical protein